MKYLWIFLVMTLLPRLAAGQCVSSQEKPTWVDGFFQEEPNSYIESATATGYSEEDARNKAAQIVMERRNLATGQRVNVQVQNGNSVITSNGELTVKARVLDEYREQCGSSEYRVSLLVQTAKNPDSNIAPLEAIKITKDYGFSPRVFVPGMAQLYKGSTTKGVLFIAGEVACIGGIVACEGLRASYQSKINTTHNVQDKQSYINNADNMQNLRNGFIAGAALVYAWNIIDGIVAKGQKHVVVLSGDNRLSITPFISPQPGNVATGLSLAFNF